MSFPPTTSLAVASYAGNSVLQGVSPQQWAIRRSCVLLESAETSILSFVGNTSRNREPCRVETAPKPLTVRKLTAVSAPKSRTGSASGRRRVHPTQLSDDHTNLLYGDICAFSIRLIGGNPTCQTAICEGISDGPCWGVLLWLASFVALPDSVFRTVDAL